MWVRTGLRGSDTSLIEEVLDRLGIDYELKGEEAWALCPMHEQRTGKPDHNPSWSINTTTGKFFCFSCRYKGSINRLISDVRGVPLEEAEQWSGSLEVDPSVLLRKVAKAKPVRIATVNDEVDEALFLSFPDPPDEELQRRHLNRSFADMYDLRYQDGWCIPIRDRDGVLRGWQTKQEGRVRNHPYGRVKKSKYLFGQFELPSNCDTVVVVESPLDAVLCSQEGYPCVALYGSGYSPRQVELLMEYQIVVLALDNDAGGLPSQQELGKELLAAGVWVRHVRYPPYIKDFGDAPERIPDLISSAVSPITEKLNKIKR